MAKRRITWTKRAARQFNAAIEYIRQDSAQNAEKVKEMILNKIQGLSDDKVVYRKDPHKKNNDGNYFYLRS